MYIALEKVYEKEACATNSIKLQRRPSWSRDNESMAQLVLPPPPPKSLLLFELSIAHD